MKIFGLSGDPKGQKLSGKDTFAGFCLDNLRGKVKGSCFAFADPLKEFCMKYIGLDRKACYGKDEDKDAIFATWGEVFGDNVFQVKYDMCSEDPISGREIMQVVGTDIFRECFRDTFWIDLMRRKIDHAKAADFDLLFITDMRFRNEVDMVKQIGGETVRIYRDILRENTIVHRSERELAELPDEAFDHVIHNEGDLDSFREITKWFLYQRGLL